MSGDGKTTQWTSYRYPKQISNSANNSDTTFAYGPDRQRYSETILRNGLTLNTAFQINFYRDESRVYGNIRILEDLFGD